jgi:hypothetical protein
MSQRKTLCDLGMVTVDFSGSDPGSTFRLTFRHRSGQQTGRIDVDRVEAEQFTAELAATITVIIAQLKSSQYTR